MCSEPKPAQISWLPSFLPSFLPLPRPLCIQIAIWLTLQIGTQLPTAAAIQLSSAQSLKLFQVADLRVKRGVPFFLRSLMTREISGPNQINRFASPRRLPHPTINHRKANRPGLPYLGTWTRFGRFSLSLPLHFTSLSLPSTKVALSLVRISRSPTLLLCRKLL